MLGFNTAPDLAIYADGKDGAVNWSDPSLLGDSFVFALDFTVTYEGLEANKDYSLITFTNNNNDTPYTLNLSTPSEYAQNYDITGSSDPQYKVSHVASSSLVTIYGAYDSINDEAHLYAYSYLDPGNPLIEEASSDSFDFWNGSNTTITLGSEDFFGDIDNRSLSFLGYTSSSFGDNNFDEFYSNLTSSGLSAAQLTAIPEPRFYGMLTGLVVLLTVIYIRKNKA